MRDAFVRNVRTGRYSILSLVISGHSLFDLYSEWEKVLVRLKITGQSILNSALYPQSYPTLLYMVYAPRRALQHTCKCQSVMCVRTYALPRSRIHMTAESLLLAAI